MNIIPRPKEEYVNDGFFEIGEKLGISSEIDGAEELVEKFFTTADRTEKEASKKVYVVFDKEVAEEGYRLTVDRDKITIEASTVKGVFYSLQTLVQISGAAAGKLSNIQCCHIEDEPRFKHRGFMLDEARHFFGKEFVKDTLKMMALMKLNVFHWHLTDDQGWRVEIKKYPLLTEKGTTRKSTQLNLSWDWMHKEKHENKPYGEGLFYTQEDIKEIVAFAKELNIEVIPEIDMPGHLTAAAACYPELTCSKDKLEVANHWGIMKTIGCAGSDELYKFVFDVIDELAPLFPSPYFHIGGDEVPKARWKKCPACQAKIKELNLKNEEELQGAFNGIIQDHLRSKGKTMIGWNEILKTGTPNPGTIVQWWIGDSKKTGVEEWLEKGNSIIITSCQFVYMDYFYSNHDLRKFYSMDYDTLELPEKYEKNIIGVEAPMWTEYVRNKNKFDFNVYPRMQALAEIGWTNKKLRNFDDFNNRVKAFGDVFKKFGIVPAPAKYYLCEGKDGKKRIKHQKRDWRKNPNAELDRYLDEKD